VIFEAPPGFGKTVVLIKMIEMLGRTTLVVVPRSNLVKQWVERLKEHSSLTDADIGVALDGKCKWKGKKIVVGLVHTLTLDRFGNGFRDHFGTVVFDEVDRSVPPATFSTAVTMFPSKYRIGASATLKRTDGMDVVFEKHIGETRITAEDANRMSPTVILHSFDDNMGDVWEGSPTLNRRGMLLSMLSKDPKRNMLIAYYIGLIHKSGRRCVVLSDRTLQLYRLRELVVGCKGIPRDETGFYVRQLDTGNRKKRSITEAERRRVASDCNVIFATYGMMALGTDIPELSALIYATPQSQVEQSKGRIERVCDGKKQPVVVDIVDTAYPDAKRWAFARQRQYRAENLKIKRYK